MMKMIASAAAITLLSAVPALAQGEANYTPSIDVANAKVEGNRITGVGVQINRTGYLVVHNDGAGAAPNSIGNIRIDPGETMDLSIDLTGDIGANPVLMLHYETNDNTTYDFGPGSTDVDTPVMNGDKPVVVPLKTGM
ncbi:hypothetical protein CSC94_10080 [Zhengella mangrovi]|uniref:DUF7282 domain-containing protein n=2 Tax=Zhengella mangrovi TaxID=1982044 RepID=A0A2G1QPD0_9HYPH|nr:hypothetical protein CSC94_10080 [Zhengella mangrovi]